MLQEIEITPALHSQFAKQWLASFAIQNIESEDNSLALTKLIQAAETAISERLELNTRATKERRHCFFVVPNTTADDYSERAFSIDIQFNKYSQRQATDSAILAGIRHAGGNKDKAFVAVQCNFGMQDENCDKIIEKLKAFAREQFGKFAPFAIQLWSSSKDFERYCKPSQLLLCQALSKTAKLSFDRLTTKTDARSTTTLDETPTIQVIAERKSSISKAYQWYSEQYAEFHKQQPDLKPWIPCNELEEFEESARQGLVYGLYIGEKLSGILQAEALEFLGHSAMYMDDILIAEEWRGLGLGAVFQSQVLARNQQRFSYVWGTIDRRNPSSLRTARKVGRRILRREYLIPL